MRGRSAPNSLRTAWIRSPPPSQKHLPKQFYNCIIRQMAKQERRGAPTKADDERTEYKTVSLLPATWEYFKQWSYATDTKPALREKNPDAWNASAAIERAKEQVQKFVPEPMEPGRAGRKRGDGGRWIGAGPAKPARASRIQLEARIRQLERQLQKAGIDA